MSCCLTPRLPILARDVETMVRDRLARCTIAIDLLGQRYGVTPEDSSESIPALQVRLTANWSLALDLQRLIWMAGGNKSADERQREFARRLAAGNQVPLANGQYPARQ
jgi:hypothetical protein